MNTCYCTLGNTKACENCSNNVGSIMFGPTREDPWGNLPFDPRVDIGYFPKLTKKQRKKFKKMLKKITKLNKE